MTPSASASWLAIVAVSRSPVFGAAWSTETESTTGAEFATVAVSVTAAPIAAPSFGVTVTEIASPLSPCPAVERSSVGPVAPATTVPFSFQT